MRRLILGLTLALLVCGAGLLPAADAFKSSLQPGESLPGVFSPLNVTGPFAGEKHCLVCENGLNPVVMIFARDVSDPLVRLVAQVDAATARHQGQSLGSFAVFLSTKQGLEKQLQEVGKKSALKHLVLSIDDPAGPEDYKVAKDAEVTVVLYARQVVKASHAFKKGELTDKAVDRVLADLPKILPDKK